MSMFKQRMVSILYDCIQVVVNTITRCSVQPKTLLVVKMDHIGDYMLWRNLLPYIRQSARFKDYRITLLGFIGWKSLFEAFDTSYVDEVIWLDRVRFKKKPGYRYQMLRRIRKAGFETVVNMIGSRCKREDDAFVLVSGCSFKIGHDSDITNVLPYEKGYDKGLYDQLHRTDNPLFQFYKNKQFTENLIAEKLPDELKPKLPFHLPPPGQLEGRKYFVVFPGSARSDKIWPADHFIATAKHVAGMYGLMPVLCGSHGDRVYVDHFLNGYAGPAIDLCGKTSLLEFANVLKYAVLLISIDTGSVHLAASVDCAVFGIFNGTRLGSFAPYPPEISPTFHAIYPKEIQLAIAQGKWMEHQGVSKIPFSAVGPEQVILQIDSFMKGNMAKLPE